MVVGELSGELTERLQRLQSVLSSVTAQSKVSSAIGGHVWSKLLFNSTFSGLGAGVDACTGRSSPTRRDVRSLSVCGRRATTSPSPWAWS